MTGDHPHKAVSCAAPIGLRITMMLCANKRGPRLRGSFRPASERSLSSATCFTPPMEPSCRAQVYRPRVRLAEQFAAQAAIAIVAERTIVRVLPSERSLSTAPEGAPLPDSQSEQPPVIRRADAVAFVQV